MATSGGGVRPASSASAIARSSASMPLPERALVGTTVTPNALSSALASGGRSSSSIMLSAITSGTRSSMSWSTR